MSDHDAGSPTWWSTSADGVRLRVRAVPGARVTAVTGLHGEDELRVRLAAPAVDGRANDELRRFVAAAFGTHKSAVRVLHGRRSRRKVLQVVGVTRPPPAVIRSAEGST